MKLVTLLFCYFTITSLWSQNHVEKGLQLKPELSFAFVSHNYFGDNYLSKGHKNPSIGASVKMNLLTYKKFLLGLEYEISTLKVDDFAIGGNIDETNSSVFRGILSYRITKKDKLIIDPQLKYGTIDLRQRGDTKFYGNQQGNSIGIGTDLLYDFSKTYSLFINLGYNYIILNVNTTPEFTDYFNHAHSINISIGLKLN